MKIVIAPDSFKGTISAMEAAICIENGIKKIIPQAEFIKIPMADGGEGTVETMIEASGGKIIKQKVMDPLNREIESHFGIMGDRETAVIEMASASGLPLLKHEERNPLITTTFGTGQLIKAALDNNVKKIILGIGGSATVDGGAGMARALGVKLCDSNGQKLAHGGEVLKKLASIDISQMDERVKNTQFLVACDVDNPLLGDNGAAKIYGPQKGATPEMVEILENSLGIYAKKIKESLNVEVADLSGAGAAGGLGAGLVAFCNASLMPGIDIVIQTIGLEEKVKDADLVITGEGQLDYQTAFGKAPAGAAKAAKKYNIPVIAIGGSLGNKASVINENGIDAYFSALRSSMSNDQIGKYAKEMLTECSEQIARTILLARKLR